MEQVLAALGLSYNEVQVYLALLRLGGATVTQLADAVGLKRTSCQEYLRSLQEKGAVNSTQQGNKFLYQSEDPDTFRQMLNERRFIVDRLVPELQKQGLQEEWRVRSLSPGEVDKRLKKAKKKGEIEGAFEGEASLFMLSGDAILLSSDNAELPAIEMKSKELADFHRMLLGAGED